MTLEGLYYELNNINDDMLTYEDMIYDDRKSFILDSISMSSKYKEWNDSDGDRINSCCTGTGQRTKKNSIDTFDKLIDRICRSTTRNERSSLYKFIRTRDIYVKDIIRRIHTSSYLIKSKLVDRLDVSDSFKLSYSKAICTTKHEVLYKFFMMLLNCDLSNYVWSFAICDFITDYGLVQGSSTLPAKYRDHLEIFSDTILKIEKFNNAFNSAELTGDDLVSVRNIAEGFSDPNNLVILDSSIKHYKLQDVIRTFAGNVSTMIKLGLAPKGVGIHYSYDGGFTFVRM